MNDDRARWLLAEDDAEAFQRENERLRTALIRYGAHLSDCVGDNCTCGLYEALSGEPDSPAETPKPSRDADHCDYPDCLQHNELVVERLRSKLDLIGRLSAHQPVVLAIQLAREALSDDPDSAPETAGKLLADREALEAWAINCSCGCDNCVRLLEYFGLAIPEPGPSEEVSRHEAAGLATGSTEQPTPSRSLSREVEDLRNHIFNGVDIMEAWIRQFGSTNQLSSETRQWCAVQIPRATAALVLGAALSQHNHGIYIDASEDPTSAGYSMHIDRNVIHGGPRETCPQCSSSPKA